MLREKDIDEIRDMYNAMEGLDCRIDSLANKYDLAKGTIYNIINYKGIYRHKGSTTKRTYDLEEN
jgi:Mor family transcriptional regulator